MKLVPPPSEKPEETAPPAPEPPPDNIRHVNFGQQSEVAPPKTGKGKCYHRGTFTLDEETRTVECHCGASLDAFTLLLQYANRERDWRYYDVERREAQKRLDELKAEERKTKSRLKNASRKDAEVAVAEERARGERERIQISEAVRDMTQLCRRLERLTQRRRTP